MRSLTATLSYAIFLPLAAVTASEILLRLCAPLEPGTRHSFEQSIPGLAPRVDFREDERGFRSRSLEEAPRSPRTVRILALGASTVRQSTQNLEDTWTATLHRRLEARFPDVSIEVAAWGVDGQRIWGAVAFCRFGDFAGFEPDIAIGLWGINSLARRGGPDYRYDGRAVRLARLEELHDARESFTNRLASVSQLAARIRRIEEQWALRDLVREGRAVGWHSEHLPRLQEHYRTLPLRRRLVREPDPLVEFREGVDEYLTCLDERGIEAIVLGQPTLWKPGMDPAEQAVLWFSLASREGSVRLGGGALSAEMRRYNAAQAEVALEHGATYFPLEDRVPRTLDFFFDDCHFTDRGSAAVADSIEPAVAAAVERVVARRGLARVGPRRGLGAP